MLGFENKNEKQLYFNQIKGKITELNDGQEYCSITLQVGHENPRMVNILAKKERFDEVSKEHNIGDFVLAYFYIVSRFKNSRWFTMANLLSMQKSTETD